VNTAYAEFFGQHRPARAVVPTRDLHHGVPVEIAARAALPDSLFRNQVSFISAVYYVTRFVSPHLQQSRYSPQRRSLQVSLNKPGSEIISRDERNLVP
jgi:hypothetical protein